MQRLLIGRILARYEERGLKVVGLKLVLTSRELAERHYAAHSERPFFGSLVDFITSSPLVAIALEGPNAIAVVRAINGATRPHEAAPGTIRGDFALETAQNIVHASDGPEAAVTELGLWFTPAELLDYDALRRHLGPAAGRVAGGAGQFVDSPGIVWTGGRPAAASGRRTPRSRSAAPRRRGPATPTVIPSDRLALASRAIDPVTIGQVHLRPVRTPVDDRRGPDIEPPTCRSTSRRP